VENCERFNLWTERKGVDFGDRNTYWIVITTIKVRESVGQGEKSQVSEEMDKSIVELEVPELNRNVGAPSFKMIRL